jgi:hypothetical protein
MPLAAAAILLLMGLWSRSPAAATAPTPPAAGAGDSTNWLLRLHDQPLSLDLANGKTLEGTFVSTLYVNDTGYFLGIKTADSANLTFVNTHQIVAFHQVK